MKQKTIAIPKVPAASRAKGRLDFLSTSSEEEDKIVPTHKKKKLQQPLKTTSNKIAFSATNMKKDFFTVYAGKKDGSKKKPHKSTKRLIKSLAKEVKTKIISFVIFLHFQFTPQSYKALTSFYITPELLQTAMRALPIAFR